MKGLEYFNEYIGGTIDDFLAPFIGAEDPIDDAICSVLYQMQRVETPVPIDFTKELRRFLVESVAADAEAFIDDALDRLMDKTTFRRS